MIFIIQDTQRNRCLGAKLREMKVHLIISPDQYHTQQTGIEWIFNPSHPLLHPVLAPSTRVFGCSFKICTLIEITSSASLQYKSPNYPVFLSIESARLPFNSEQQQKSKRDLTRSASQHRMEKLVTCTTQRVFQLLNIQSKQFSKSLL